MTRFAKATGRDDNPLSPKGDHRSRRAA